MAKYLVIVESPAKVKTIKKFLGKNYEVAASNGHVRDLPKSQMGIDVENDFEPKYITIRGKGDILAALRKEVKKADVVYLATDPDREGEAISWHLTHALNLAESDYKRITFNEITKTAVKNSLKNSRKIDMNLVDAQQARRVLDRLVGYEISPILWAKVKRGLSAGRVQSAALRIICDREDEINAFIPKEYWSLDAILQMKGAKKPVTAKFFGDANGKIEINTEEEVKKILSDLEGADFVIKEIKRGKRTKKAPLPFTTSTLQQEASRHLNFSTQKTMRIAQQLYEGVQVKGHGSIGLITYLRTDSTRISQEADEAARAYIAEQFGEEYLPKTERKGNNGSRIQDAHEAIRPTNISLTPVQVKESLSRDQFRLYQLIWNRFAASRMSAAVYETVAIEIGADRYIFHVNESRIGFRGFLSVYALDEEKQVQTIPASLTEETELTVSELKEEQHFTQPPAHFTEASLVKAMEDLGIGRPSTYAPTITTLLSRHYIVKEKKNLFVSELGEVVNEMIVEAFPEIVDQHFTANMESLLDGVEEGSVPWKTIIRNFYPDLEKEVVAAQKELEHVKVQDEVSDVICDKCGRNMVIKYGPHGKFLACPGFPDCRNTMPFLEKIGIPCPKCGKEVVIRRTKKGRRFYGCEDYPNCDFTSWKKPEAEAK
ncbi:MAG: type I DNA topoisomerase [Eubacterium sp.]|nr:type I DNA topoisomerase [Eubacterium sp.]